MDILFIIEFIKLVSDNLSEAVPILGSMFISLMVVLRLLAEILNKIAERTETDLDNKSVSLLRKGVRLMAKAAACFGVGPQDKFK